MAVLRRVGALVIIAALAGLVAVGSGQQIGSPDPAGAVDKPNIVLIKVDDMTYDELSVPGVMDQLRNRFADNGTTMTNYYVSIALCCPDRAATLSGQYAHNNKVPNNNAYKFFAHGNTVAKWLQDNGYYTSLIGKYMNGYACTKPIPAGWTDWQALCKNVYSMYNYTIRDNAVTQYYGYNVLEYQTDVLSYRAEQTINEAVAADKPFFLNVWPTAPHGGSGTRWAARHATALSSWTLPAKPNFNETDVSDKPAWVRALTPISKSQRNGIEKSERTRLRMLLAVDDLVENVYQTLVETDTLDNTIVMFTSDNGFMRGEHRIRQSKEVWYEESTRQPLIISGPGVPSGVTNHALVMNVDLAPTITAITGSTAGRTFDGQNFWPKLTDPTLSERRPMYHMQVPDTTPNIVRGHAVRTSWGLKYMKLDSGEDEMYDLTVDPFELDSVHASPAYADAKADLAAMVDLLKTCIGALCRNEIPLPSFTASCDTARLCSLDASGSTDDGTIASYAWTFPGGATASGVTASHTFASDGTHPVKLRVTDNQGFSWTTTANVTVDGAPTASFTTDADGLAVDVDATASADPGGSITAYDWDFGDGNTGTGMTATHTYAAAGTYTIELTVTDSGANTATTTHTVTVSDTPTAAFTPTVTGFQLDVDASASSDDIGITAYAWDFGDGNTGTGMTATHTYAATGTYTVELTVTDDIGQTATITLPVEIT